ncbi:MAG: DUF1800 domain-containing protein [Thaumarchaeota archaeon]|nr:DUF1800 domain-containing protein [Nitrososphaerota archaeon]
MLDRNRRRFLKAAGATSALAAASLSVPKAAACYFDYEQMVADLPKLIASVPTIRSLTEREKIAHLLRRAGFGATEAELDAYEQKGLDRTITELVNYPVSEPKLEDAISKLNLRMDRLADVQTWWITRMVLTERPLLEKMVFFWHGHFATSIRKVNNVSYMLQQNQFFRSNALGDFREILLGISKDPAMLVWLDSNSNRKGAPNENYGRELLELFSMGIGNYTESDVKEAARAFTGWHVDNQKGAFVFNSRLHDDGLKTFLGRTGNFDGTDIIDIDVQQLATAKFISKKLFSFFAYENPEPEILGKLADVYFKSNRSIKAIVEAILRSEEFYSPKGVFTMVRSPVDLVVSARRLAGGQINIGAMVAAMRRSGQELFAPPDVSGWETGIEWISTARLLERFNYGATVAGAAANGTDIVSQARAKRIVDPVALADFVSTRILQRYPQEERRRYLERLARESLGTSPNNQTIERATRSLIAVITATPEFQLE